MLKIIIKDTRKMSQDFFFVSLLLALNLVLYFFIYMARVILLRLHFYAMP